MALLPDGRPIRGARPLDCPDTCSDIVTVRDGEPVDNARGSFFAVDRWA